VDNRGVLRPSTPAGHPVISAVWLASIVLLVASVLLALARSFAYPVPAVVGVLWLFLGWIAYLLRHRRFESALAIAERRIRDGDLTAARATLAPLLAAFPHFPPIQRAAGLLLYAGGDPLSAASLLESALAGADVATGDLAGRVAALGRAATLGRAGGDPALVTTLVASYAALNKGGDARRAARLLASHPEVRLALAWSELVALGGDRAEGARLVEALANDGAARATAERRAMLGTLVSIASARAGEAARARAALAEVEAASAGLAPADRAFVGYLGGVALRELGDTEGARRTFAASVEVANGTIGAALALRERSHLPEPGGS